MRIVSSDSSDLEAKFIPASVQLALARQDAKEHYFVPWESAWRPEYRDLAFIGVAVANRVV
jgi:hypothetical protein